MHRIRIAHKGPYIKRKVVKNYPFCHDIGSQWSLRTNWMQRKLVEPTYHMMRYQRLKNKLHVTMRNLRNQKERERLEMYCKLIKKFMKTLNYSIQAHHDYPRFRYKDDISQCLNAANTSIFMTIYKHDQYDGGDLAKLPRIIKHWFRDNFRIELRECYWDWFQIYGSSDDDEELERAEGILISFPYKIF